MKKEFFFLINIFFVALVLIACNSYQTTNTSKVDDTASSIVENKTKSPLIDYSGTYTIEDKNVCNLTIEIQKKGLGFYYIINDSEGNVKIETDGEATYLIFIGLNGTSPAGDVECKYENQSIIIQNQGNSINSYNHFKNCDAKFLELKKITKSI